MPSRKLRRQLAFVTAVSNPARYQTRYRLYRKFADHIEKGLGQRLVTVECQLGDRPFEITDAGNPDHVQVRSNSELWHKENMLNVAMSRLPTTIKYICWVDADVEFLRADIVDETIHQLQHHSVVQMFQHCLDMGPSGEILHTHSSFAYVDKTRQQFHPSYRPYAPGATFMHPGYAWAARRDFLDQTGGLFDVGVAGAGDHHMALALTGRVQESAPGGVHPKYHEALWMWQEKALRACTGGLGYVNGSILHSWHGPKKARQYESRWHILTEQQFDPTRDIEKNVQGVWELTGTKPVLRQLLGNYLKSRDEDSTSVD